MATLMALHAHPDDESSKGAATVARYADAGVHCILVTATGGEAGDILNPAMDRPDVRENLAEYRRKELEDAARIIGYDEIVMLGYRDSGMPESDDNANPAAFVNADYDELLGRVVALVRSRRPDVFLGYDSHEFYPHPDHLRVHALTMDIVAAAADPDRFPGAGEPWRIKRLVASLFSRRGMLAIHEMLMERDGESPFTEWVERISAGDWPERPTLSVPVGPTLQRGRDALRAHATQVDPDGFWFKVPIEVTQEVYPYEDFEIISGFLPTTEGIGDLFSGIS
ncbi:MAG: mycothiol conjugate amidase Mca [Actinobacteria bacterium]|nr:mycothiol conjugate amidase Mca [Actinomycetota bacterium]